MDGAERPGWLHALSCQPDGRLRRPGRLELDQSGLFPLFIHMALQPRRSEGNVRRAPAILGDIESRTVGLLVESPGTHKLTFDWSCAGRRVQRLRFDRIPSCVITSFELDLPADDRLCAARTVPGHGPVSSATAAAALDGGSLRPPRIELLRVPDRRDRGRAVVPESRSARTCRSTRSVRPRFCIEASRGAVRAGHRSDSRTSAADAHLSQQRARRLAASADA